MIRTTVSKEVLRSLKLGIMPGPTTSSGSSQFVRTVRNYVDALGFARNDKRYKRKNQSYFLTRSCLSSLRANNGLPGYGSKENFVYTSFSFYLCVQHTIRSPVIYLTFHGMAKDPDKESSHLFSQGPAWARALLRRLHLYHIVPVNDAAPCPSLLDLEIVCPWKLHNFLHQFLQEIVSYFDMLIQLRHSTGHIEQERCAPCSIITVQQLLEEMPGFSLLAEFRHGSHLSSDTSADSSSDTSYDSPSDTSYDSPDDTSDDSYSNVSSRPQHGILFPSSSESGSSSDWDD